MSTMTVSDVRQIVQDARAGGRVPDLSHANLRGADLSGANLYDATLYRADLNGADLTGANLRRVDLTDATLHDANLSGAKLSGANLYGADLYDADLQRVIGWDGLHMINLHHYPIHLTATPYGWSIRIGCWTGTADELELLISQDKGWPESTGMRIVKNRALLTAALVVIRAHADAHPTAINDAVQAHENW